MDFFNGIVNFGLGTFFAAFSWAPPAAGLTVLAAVIGIAMLWIFRKASDQPRIRAIKKKVYAYLLEMRVYSDEPAATWRAQKALFGANLRYMGLTLRPALFMVVPISILLIHLEGFYGRGPLEPGRPALVTAEISGDLGDAPALRAPSGIEVSAPPVRIPDQHQVTWRIVPHQAVSGELEFDIAGSKFSKTVEAGGGPRFIPGRRVQSALSAFWHPDEQRIPGSRVQWVDISYPDAGLRVFGFSINWLLWFVLISMVSALLLKKRFGVSI